MLLVPLLAFGFICSSSLADMNITFIDAGQADAAVGLVVDEPSLGERLHHRRGRAGSDAHRHGQAAHGDEGFSGTLAFQVDPLQVVLDFDACHGPLSLSIRNHGFD